MEKGKGSVNNNSLRVSIVPQGTKSRPSRKTHKWASVETRPHTTPSTPDRENGRHRRWKDDSEQRLLEEALTKNKGGEGRLTEGRKSREDESNKGEQRRSHKKGRRKTSRKN